LKQFAADAEAASSAGNFSEALRCWRAAIELLPPGSSQHKIIQTKIVELSKQLDEAGTQATAKSTDPSSKWTGGIFITALIFIATKGKLLLLGLSKAGTVFTMLLSFALYWQIWGWMFAAGFVLSIYVHEMGHVAALRHYGIPATAPMFIPGIGAFVRLKQYPATASEDAYVGLAGPVWGLGAAIASYLMFLYFNHPVFAAIAHIGALLNIFNLMPLGPIDGGRGFRAMSTSQRWLATLAVGIAWHFTNHEGMLLLVGIVAVGRSMMSGAPKKGDHRALLKYIFLIAALSWLITINVPTPAGPGAPGAAPPAATPAETLE
jgi:Zn-dependent protease